MGAPLNSQWGHFRRGLGAFPLVLGTPPVLPPLTLQQTHPAAVSCVGCSQILLIAELYGNTAAECTHRSPGKCIYLITIWEKTFVLERDVQRDCRIHVICLILGYYLWVVSESLILS